MTNSFKYVFVETNSSWAIGSSHFSLSFSSDGTTIAGTTKDTNRLWGTGEGQVQFWETATGAATFSFERSSFVVFSPTDPNMAALVRSDSVHILKRDSFGGKTWGGQYRLNGAPDPTHCIFNSDGKTIVVSSKRRELLEFDATTCGTTAGSLSISITRVVCCPIRPDWFVVTDSQGRIDVISKTATIVSKTAYTKLKSHCRLTPVYYESASACAWSQDGKWIATGNDVGDVFLWNASDPMNVSFAMLLPRNRSSKTTVTSLVFVPDNTALIINSGSCLSVWDIAKVEYVINSGLPDTAMNIALDGPRNRLAVAANERITIYELKLAEQMCQMDGRSSIPSELAEFDITNAVVLNLDPEPFVGSYFDIHRGAWKLETPRIFEHVVAIKVLRPSFRALGDAQQGGQGFEDRLLRFLRRWSELTHDNLVPLLGISTDFGEFPAVITSWMTNCLLSEYIKSEEEYDEMELVIGVAKGVAYLHSEDIVHSDIRGSGVLIDDFGQARLADPGLLCVLANGPLTARRIPYSWDIQIREPYCWMAPELLKNPLAKATFATDVYSFTMTSLEIFTADDPYQDVPDILVSQVIAGENRRPDRPDDVDDNLWSLWGEGWNQDAALRPGMESYVERLTQLA